MSSRIVVKKTYKLYIGGHFPRSESGRVLPLLDSRDEVIASYCRASRKDFRNAVVAARKAFDSWAGKTAYLRGQILYRVAEMLEGRTEQFVEELRTQGLGNSAARKEVAAAVDRWVHYAGWSDKYSQVFSSVNPVASAHFNFSRPEPTGVIGMIAPADLGLLALSEGLGRLLTGGNSVVLLAGSKYPLSAITLAEVLATSDVPGGVVNILTGEKEELLPHIGAHMDVNGILYFGNNEEEKFLLQEHAAQNVKRLRLEKDVADQGDPYRILDFQEIKTTWHPVGV